MLETLLERKDMQIKSKGKKGGKGKYAKGDKGYKGKKGSSKESHEGHEAEASHEGTQRPLKADAANLDSGSCQILLNLE